MVVYPRGKEVPLGEYKLSADMSTTEDTNLYTTELPDPLNPPVNATTYIYHDIHGLEADIWSFQDFVRYKADAWYHAEESA